MTTADLLKEVFDRLAKGLGPLHWWPAETPFEVVVGAILTQNTAWTNVEKAIANLKGANVLSPGGMRAIPSEELEELIRPAGFFRQKAERLQLFTEHLFEKHAGNLAAMLEGPTEEVRTRLLLLKGVGPETADSILLYAGDHPSFVVDAYTRRLFGRLGLLEGDESYDTIRAIFMEHLPLSIDLFNEYHALIVEECKTVCRKRVPRCSDCALKDICPCNADQNVFS